ncbi:MAG: polysaccharide biosynthesis/export family protein, partial [Acidobacteriia bacterium]|nr:polysaccharide biosynthesis/export family protein [Terriglobia bacterium]
LSLFVLTAADSPTPAPADPNAPAVQPAGVQKPDAPLAETDPIKLAKPNALGEKIVGGGPLDPNAYVIGAEDVLSVSVWHEPELTRQVTVRPDGKITLPLAGELTAAGLTPTQLNANIAEGLKKYMVSPEVNVSVQSVNSKKYYIQGEVLRPGTYNLVVPTTVMEGLANAGGFRDFANLKKITILRGTGLLHFNYKEVRAGKHLEQNILLQPGDQILVP